MHKEMLHPRLICSSLSNNALYFSSFILKALLHVFQREQEMRVGELGPRGAGNMGDGFNQASAGPTGNQGQMMGVSGRGGAITPEGASNMGTPLMSENGAMRNDRYPQGGSMGGRSEVESPKQQQQLLGPQGGPAPGYGRGSPVPGVFDGPNSKRRRY
ncbi:hypothetical protein AMECASPLE_011109 [Ameca splendens]|uniref:Uncharacterized protein n=3 Tax=Goodeidae TaxID=28758 RepID=A0ABU7B312_9TELE|nr:hypothetical protein [Ataeniobius toweri]MED6280493.1 hypothetical protein [Characodon lateralis]